jgi:hypothetical protein
MGDFVISLERFCGRVVQSNRSGRTRLVNTVEMSGKIAHTAHVQRTMLQREAPTLVISHQAESLPGCLTLRSARTVRIHNWTEAESSLLGPNDGVPLLSHCSLSRKQGSSLATTMRRRLGFPCLHCDPRSARSRRDGFDGVEPSGHDTRVDSFR